MTEPKPDLPTIIGRERERAALVESGGAVAVILRGEPGIGKSRLLAEARAVHGRRTIFARCHRASVSVAEPLAAALRAFGTGSSADDATGDGRDRLPALRDALVRAAAEAPIVVQLDDVHLLSPPALDELVLCVDRLQDSAIRWHLALRPDPNTVEAVTALRSPGLGYVLDLEPLERAEADAFVARVDPAISSRERDRLYLRSGGNPFYLEQLASAHAAARPMSGDLQTLLRNRIAALPPEARTVAEALSIAGGALDASTLAIALGRSPETVEQNLADLVAFRIVRPVEGRFEFVHDVLREVCVADVDAERRRSLHDAFATIVDSPLERAIHLAGAGRGRESGLLSIELAEAAFAARDVHDARANVARARFVAPEEPDLAWRIAIADAVLVCADGAYELGADMLRASLPPPLSIDGATRARCLRTVLLVGQDPRTPSNAVAVDAALADPAIPASLTLPFRFTRVTALYNDARFAEARAEIAAALDIIGGDEDTRFELRCVDCMIDAYEHPARARTTLAALAADPASRHVRSYPTVFRCLAHIARTAEESSQQYTHAKASLAAVRHPSTPITGPLTLLAEAALSCGKPLEALDACHAVYARNARVGVVGFFGTTVVELEAYAWLGRFDDAARALAEIDTTTLPERERAEFAFADGAIEELRGDDERAIPAYERAAAFVDTMLEDHSVSAVAALVRVWALRGDAGRAHDAWERLRTFPKSMPVPPRVLAEARLYLALADGADRAVLERRFADVATIDRNLLWTAWAQVNVSERTRDRDGFRAAIETFERAESRVMAARARKRANALGFRFAVSLAERDVLTPRELAAARLVAKGKTNKEISTMLDMSPKTVAHHVAAILMKTGMRSRVEIAAHVAAGKPFAASDFSSN